MNLGRISRQIIGWIEVLIGTATLLGCTTVQAWGVYSIPAKPFNVYVFVVATAVVAVVLGGGLIARKEWARVLLTFFAGYIILTKILIHSGLMTFSGPMITIIPQWGVDTLSVLYHSIIIIVLSWTPKQ